MSNNESGATRAADLSSIHRYRTEIPNIIDEMDLSVYAFRLYVRLKRVAGDGGKCFYTTRQLAEQCRMSAGSVSNAKQELIDKELIRVESGDKWTRDNITIIDMWPANFAYFAQEKAETACSPHEQIPETACSPHEQAQDASSVHHMNTSVHHMNAPVHHMNTKEEPYKERTNKEEPKGEGAAPRPAPPSDEVEFVDGEAVTAKQGMYAAICEACGWDRKLLAEREQFEVAELVKTLMAAKYRSSDICSFMTDVWVSDFRWQKNKQRPKLDDIRKGIGQLRSIVPEQMQHHASKPTGNVATGLAAIDEYERMKERLSIQQ